MPQLDLVLLYSQSFSGILLFFGFVFFLKYYFPFITLFVKEYIKKNIFIFLESIKTNSTNSFFFSHSNRYDYTLKNVKVEVLFIESIVSKFVLGFVLKYKF